MGDWVATQAVTPRHKGRLLRLLPSGPGRVSLRRGRNNLQKVNVSLKCRSKCSKTNKNFYINKTIMRVIYQCRKIYIKDVTI